MEFLPAIAMITLVIKIIDFLRYARARDLNGVFSQAAVWFAGIIVVMLAAQTDWAATLRVGDLSLNQLGLWSQVFWGLSFASTASFGKDVTKAVDNSNSAAIPTLLDNHYSSQPTAQGPDVG